MSPKLVHCIILVSLLFVPVWGGVRAQAADPAAVEITDPATVRTVQRALRDKGLYGGLIDGVVEEETRKALLDFQEQAHINRSGMVDRPTLEALGILEDDRSLVKKTGDGTVQTAEAVGQATVTGVTVAGESTAKGLTVAGKSTAKGVTVALESTATGLETAGKGVAKAGEATLDTAAKAGKTISQGTKKLGKATTGGVKRTGQGVTDFLDVSQSDNKIRKQLVKKLDRDPYLQDSQVRVLVEEGVATLTFPGGSPEDYDRAAAIARAVKGVKDVEIRHP